MINRCHNTYQLSVTQIVNFPVFLQVQQHKKVRAPHRQAPLKKVSYISFHSLWG